MKYAIAFAAGMCAGALIQQWWIDMTRIDNLLESLKAQGKLSGEGPC